VLTDIARREFPHSGSPPGEVTGVDVEFHEIQHWFRDVRGNPTHALAALDRFIPAGQFVAFVGPSGCGKTTALNMVAGLVSPVRGKVAVDNTTVTGPRRDVGYMFARDCLVPWRNARRNVEMGLELHGAPRSERRERAIEFLDMVELSSNANSFPKQLSQGMRQRVAIARTLAMDPRILLLDEPFAALDAMTRIRVQTLFMNMWEPRRSTVLFVTHDLQEAVRLADRVVVFSSSPGRVLADIEISIPRSRDLETVHLEPEFIQFNAELQEVLAEGRRTNDD
jgi:NitT/TauT family transport system ATP-binding protein